MAEYVNILVEDRLEKINARTNAVFGQIMAKLEILRLRSLSSSHGVTNSSNLSPIQPIHSHLNSPKAASFHEIEKRLAKSSHEIKQLCTRIRDPLQEEIGASNSVNATVLVSDTIVPSMAPITNQFVTKDTALPSSDAFLPLLESILDPESVCETKMVEAVTSTCDVVDDVGKLAITGSLSEIHGTTTKRERRFTQIGLNSTTEKKEITVNNHASSMESKFQLHWDDLLTKHKVVLVSIYGNLAVDVTGIQYDSRLIPPDKFIERLLDRAHPYVHRILVVEVTQDLHCWNSHIQLYAQSGLLNFAHHVFAEMCEQSVFSWTGLILGSVTRVNGWNGKQVNSDFRSLPSFTGWYEAPLPKPSHVTCVIVVYHLQPPHHSFQLTQGEFHVTRISAVPPPPPEPPNKDHIMVVLQEFVTLTFPKLIGLRSLYRNIYRVTSLIYESLSILSQLVVLDVFDNNLYTMVSIILSPLQLLSYASYALTCSVDLKVTTQMVLSLSRNVTMSLLLQPRDDMFAALGALVTNVSSPTKTIMTSIFVILPPTFLSLFDPGGTHLVTTLLLKLKGEVIMHFVPLRCFDNIPVQIISAEIPPPKPPDYLTIMLPPLVHPLIDQDKDDDMKQLNPGNLFSTLPHCSKSHVFMHNKKVPPKSHRVIFHMYQCVVADKYLELSHICGVKFQFKLQSENWVYGFLAGFTYTHNNLLSLASGIEKGTCHICYCLQLQPLHKNVNIEFYLGTKCTKCHSCGSNISGSVLGVIWFLGYTYQYACGEWFIKGNYCTAVKKVSKDLEQEQFCQSGNITTQNSLTFTTWISPLISLGSEYASDYEGLFLVKERILETFANNWLCFHYKFTALWGDHEQGIGEAYLQAIYYTPKDQLVIQKNHFTDLFHGIAVSIMLMRIDGVTYVEEFESSIDADTHTELLEETLLVLHFHQLQCWCLSLDSLQGTYEYKILKYKDEVPLPKLYLNFNLEDKVDFKGEGIVMNQPNWIDPNKSELTLAQEIEYQSMSWRYITQGRLSKRHGICNW